MPRTTTNTRTQIQNIPCSLSFNGTSSKVVATAISGFGTAFTVGCWVKFLKVAGLAEVVANATSSSDEFCMGLTSSSVLCATYYNGTTTFSVSYGNTTVFQSGNCYYLVATFNGSVLNFYVNGVAQTGTTALGLASTASLVIGARNDSARFAQANISQVKIYTSALSPQQVTQLYTTGSTNVAPTAQYLLTEGAGTTAYDTSGNGNNGTITAGTYTSDVPTTTRKLVGGNLVYNGNFEFAPPTNVAQTGGTTFWVDGTSNGSSTNSLLGWGVLNATNGSCLFDSANSRSGNYAMKVSTTTTGGLFQTATANSAAHSVQVFIPSTIPINPNTSYTITYWMKTTANSGAANTGAQLILSERAGSNSQSQATNGNTGVTTTTGWTQYTKTWTTASTSAFLLIKLSVTGNDGTATLIMDAWFDDIVLTPTTNTKRTSSSNRSLAV